MRILLITPPQDKNIQAGVPGVFYDLRGIHPPMGLLYIESFLSDRTDDHNVQIYDIYGESDSEEIALKKIKRINPDLVAVQMLTFSAPNTTSFLSKLKAMNSSIITVVGGPHPTIYPEKTASLPMVDYAILGEGEIPFYKLVENIKSGNRHPKIKAVAYKIKDSHYINKDLNVLDDVDKIPPVDRRLLNLDNYRCSFSGDKKITSLATSRGCPYSCVFCAEFEDNFRTHSPEYVLKDIKDSVELGIEEIFVVDDAFSLNIKRAKNICRLIINENLDFDWYINTRVDAVDEELLRLLKKAGCKQINYGIESGSQRIINNLNKGIDLQEAEEAIRKTKEAEIDVLCYFMIGSPGETIKDIKKTKEFIKRSDPDFVRFSLTTIEPCTQLYQMALDRGILDQDVWSEFATKPTKNFEVPIWNENFTKEELNEMLISISKKHYTRPKFILKNLMKIRSWNDFKKGLSSFIKIVKM